MKEAFVCIVTAVFIASSGASPVSVRSTQGWALYLEQWSSGLLAL